VGTATLRIVLSSTITKRVLDRITSAIHRVGSGASVGAPQPAVVVVVVSVIAPRRRVRVACRHSRTRVRQSRSRGRPRSGHAPVGVVPFPPDWSVYEWFAGEPGSRE